VGSLPGGLQPQIGTATVAPNVRVTGLSYAVNLLAAALGDVRRDFPDLYAELGTQGMFCYRNIRGSSTSVSNHSWGTAVDLTVSGQTDAVGNDHAAYGLLVLARYLNSRGFYWGGGFTNEDGMHFELSQQEILIGRQRGMITPFG
jgi:hypothetical protein